MNLRYDTAICMLRRLGLDWDLVGVMSLGTRRMHYLATPKGLTSWDMFYVRRRIDKNWGLGDQKDGWRNGDILSKPRQARKRRARLLLIIERNFCRQLTLKDIIE